jgi:hypothetical protein
MIDFISIHSDLPLSLCLILLERQHVREASAESMRNVCESYALSRKINDRYHSVIPLFFLTFATRRPFEFAQDILCGRYSDFFFCALCAPFDLAQDMLCG